MFAEPTIDDFVARIEDHIQRSLDNTRHTVRKIEAANSAAGRYQSGATVKQIFREVLAEFERGMDGALQKFRQSIKVGKLDAFEMRELLGEHLGVYRDQMKGITKHEKLRGFSSGPAWGRAIDEELEKFDEFLAFRLRQFDVGFNDPKDSHMGGVVIVHGDGNSVIAGNNNIAQQGTKNSQQTVNSADIVDRLDILEKELIAAQLPAPNHSEIRSDIETIKAQLKKQEPSTSIVREAAKSIARMVEATVGGALVHPLITAASALLDLVSH